MSGSSNQIPADQLRAYVRDNFHGFFLVTRKAINTHAILYRTTGEEALRTTANYAMLVALQATTAEKLSKRTCGLNVLGGVNVGVMRQEEARKHAAIALDHLESVAEYLGTDYEVRVKVTETGKLAVVASSFSREIEGKELARQK